MQIFCNYILGFILTVNLNLKMLVFFQQLNGYEII